MKPVVVLLCLFFAGCGSQAPPKKNVVLVVIDTMRADRASIEELHKTEFDTTGTARMSAAPELRVAPGETFKLEPGGMHVMLIDVESPLVEGETLPLRLKFYDGDDIIVDVPILAADARGPQE